MNSDQQETQEPPLDPEAAAAAALARAQQNAVLDLVVEVVESRYQKRRVQDRRWWIGIIVAGFTLYAAAGALYYSIIEDSIGRVEAEAETANRRLDTPEQTTPPSANVIQPGSAQEVDLGLDERARYLLDIQETATYRLDAIAATDSDPVLYLYQQEGGTLVTVRSDDDGGDGLNSRIVETLSNSAIYYIEVEDLFGEPGSFTLSVALANTITPGDQ